MASLSEFLPILALNMVLPFGVDLGMDLQVNLQYRSLVDCATWLLARCGYLGMPIYELRPES